MVYKFFGTVRSEMQVCALKRAIAGAICLAFLVHGSAWADELAQARDSKQKSDSQLVSGAAFIRPGVTDFWQRVATQPSTDPFIGLHVAHQAWQLEDYSLASSELKRFSMAVALPPNGRGPNPMVKQLALESLQLDLFAAYSVGQTPAQSLAAGKSAYGFGRQISASLQLSQVERANFLLRYKQMHSLLQSDLSYGAGLYSDAARHLGVLFNGSSPLGPEAGGEFGPAGRRLFFLTNLRQVQTQGQLAQELAVHEGLASYGIWPTVPAELDSDYRRIRAVYLAQPQKSKPLAVALATILPGSGHWYLGRGADALASFGAVAVLGGLSALSFASNSAFLGATFAAGASAFYAGNIYGAWRAADSVRATAEKRFLFQLELRFRPKVEVP